jgi:hypothetical protein
LNKDRLSSGRRVLRCVGNFRGVGLGVASSARPMTITGRVRPAPSHGRLPGRSTRSAAPTSSAYGRRSTFGGSGGTVVAGRYTLRWRRGRSSTADQRDGIRRRHLLPGLRSCAGSCHGFERSRQFASLQRSIASIEGVAPGPGSSAKAPSSRGTMRRRNSARRCVAGRTWRRNRHSPSRRRGPGRCGH